MRVILFMAILMAFMFSCNTTQKPDFTADVKAVVKVQYVIGEKTEDGTCLLSFKKDAEGIIIDSKCVGFYQDDTGTYRCDVAVGSDGQPITKKIDVKASCTLDIAK